jgi:hypothetical protein
MSVIDKPPAYRSYLLRFWEERSEQPAMRVWRFSLEDPLTAQQHHFPSLEALTTWLKTEMADASQSPHPAK